MTVLSVCLASSSHLLSSNLDFQSHWTILEINSLNDIFLTISAKQAAI